MNELFDEFPYTNYQQMNMDWILRKLRELEERVQALEDAQEGE